MGFAVSNKPGPSATAATGYPDGAGGGNHEEGTGDGEGDDVAARAVAGRLDPKGDLG
jgi:hypothetical protein